MQMWHFVRHFIEMCLAMCIGVAVLGAYVLVTEQFGVTDRYLRLPALTAFVLAFNMSVPMVAWMRFCGMAWGPEEFDVAAPVWLICASGFRASIAASIAAGLLERGGYTPVVLATGDVTDVL